MQNKEIYLDNSATTRICKEALEVYNRVSLSCFGNPSSLHAYGHSAEKELDAAREAVRHSLNAMDSEVIFTASGSEANNLAIFGRIGAKERFRPGKKIITTDGEHASVNEPLEKLKERGYKIVRIPTKGGALDEGALIKELDCDTVLVTMMLVNNETGAVYNIPRVSQIMKKQCPDGVLHVDATQAYLKIPFSMSQLGADMITLSSHKIEGPKGVGALAVSSSVIKSRGISPIIFGGGQEGGMRSGTENVPGIAAFGEAVRIGSREVTARFQKTDSLRSYFIERLADDVELKKISPTLPCVHAPHIINITLPDIKSETMLHHLSSLGIYVSSGSACSSNTAHISSALTAYGRSGEEAACSIRISFSHTNEREDVDALCRALSSGISRLAKIRN